MRTLEDVRSEYEEAVMDSELVKDPDYSHVYCYKNQCLRDKLIEEYESLLPLNQRLAVYIGRKKWIRDFPYECDGCNHNWERYFHSKSLAMSERLINLVGDDWDKLVNIVNTLL